MIKDKGTYIYDGNVYDLFLSASDILAKAVTHTLGPKGTNSAIPTQNEYLSIINDGKSIVERLSSDDKALRFAMNTLKESSFATNQRASDGTSSSLVVQNQLLNHIKEWNEAFPLTPIDSKFLIEARDKLLELLKVMKDYEAYCYIIDDNKH